jgi:hypothetical protein
MRALHYLDCRLSAKETVDTTVPSHTDHNEPGLPFISGCDDCVSGEADYGAFQPPLGTAEPDHLLTQLRENLKSILFVGDDRRLYRDQTGHRVREWRRYSECQYRRVAVSCELRRYV